MLRVSELRIQHRSFEDPLRRNLPPQFPDERRGNSRRYARWFHFLGDRSKTRKSPSEPFPKNDSKHLWVKGPPEPSPRGIFQAVQKTPQRRRRHPRQRIEKGFLG